MDSEFAKLQPEKVVLGHAFPGCSSAGRTVVRRKAAAQMSGLSTWSRGTGAAPYFSLSSLLGLSISQLFLPCMQLPAAGRSSKNSGTLHLWHPGCILFPPLICPQPHFPACSLLLPLCRQVCRRRSWDSWAPAISLQGCSEGRCPSTSFLGCCLTNLPSPGGFLPKRVGSKPVPISKSHSQWC